MISPLLPPDSTVLVLVPVQQILTLIFSFSYLKIILNQLLLVILLEFAVIALRSRNLFHVKQRASVRTKT